MTFDVVTVRSLGDQQEDAGLYPAPAAAGDQLPFRLTSGETGLRSLGASALSIFRSKDGRKREVVSLPDRPVDVFVTDSRVVVACRKFDTGARWSGVGAGAALAVAANGVSRAVAAHRTRDLVMLGQVRYPWLSQVGGSPKQKWLDSNQLRITLQEPSSDGGAWLLVDIVFKSSVDVCEIAADIARRCARDRLGHDHALADEERARLLTLTAAESLPAQPGKFALHQMPTHYRARERTAFYPSPQ